MAPPLSEHVLNWYETHRRENFAASQRLEGIRTPATRADSSAPLPTRTELIERYTAVRKR